MTSSYQQNLNSTSHLTQKAKVFLVDDSHSVVPNAPTFKEHRHDQSIFSLLVKTKGGIIIPNEVEFKNRLPDGKKDKKILSPYPPLANEHNCDIYRDLFNVCPFFEHTWIKFFCLWDCCEQKTF